MAVKSLRSMMLEGEMSTHRLNIQHVINSETICLVLLVTIIYHLILTVFETDYRADGGSVPVWVEVSNYWLMVFYSLEFVMRVYVERRRWFLKPLCVIEGIALIADVVILIWSSTNSYIAILVVLRPMRLLRIAKSMNVMKGMPELAHMIRGMSGALVALFWGGTLVFFVLCIWGVLAVRIIHPLNQELDRQGVWEHAGCERCPRAFETVTNSMLTFTQSIIAGDSWGVMAVPIIEHYPATAVFFSLVLLSIDLAIMNLLLAIVLDKANETRAQTERELLVFKEEQKAQAVEDFIGICQEMDQDESGSLTLQEIEDGYRENEDFRTTLRLMDVDEEDLWLVFRMLDDDQSGSVMYEEFATNLSKMRTRDIHTMISFIRFYVSDLWKRQRDADNQSQKDGAPRRRASARSNAGVGSNALSDMGNVSDSDAKAPDALPFVEKPTVARSSSWSQKLNQAAPVQHMPQETKLPQPGISEDIIRLQNDLSRVLGAISEKLEVQTRMLESMPMASERAIRHRSASASLRLPREDLLLRQHCADEHRHGTEPAKPSPPRPPKLCFCTGPTLIPASKSQDAPLGVVPLGHHRGGGADVPGRQRVPA